MLDSPWAEVWFSLTQTRSSWGAASGRWTGGLSGPTPGEERMKLNALLALLTPQDLQSGMVPGGVL